MPPPRPRSMGAPNPNTPMSERQQMALLIQMTASSDNIRSTQKSKEHKKDDDFDESHFSEKTDGKDKPEELHSENKKDGSFDIVNSAETSSNILKRNFSDIDEEECDDADDVRKKKRKELEVMKDIKQPNNQRVANRVEKSVKQNNTKSNSALNKSINTSDKDDLIKGKSLESEVDDDDSKSDPLCSGCLKVPPLKIVIPQQNCAIDSDCTGSRAGKLNATRNPALPYVVASNTDSNDRDPSTTNTSPRDSPIKLNHSCGTSDEKNSNTKLNEEKNLRVLRSSHRVGLSASDRNSNNSSPQIPSNSPSPASSTANDLVDSKTVYPNANGSPTHQNISFEHDNILNLPSPSTSSTSSSKEVLTNNVELHPRKRKIRAKTEDVKTNTGNNDIVVCSDSHPHDLPFTNCFQMYMNIRRQIEKKWKNVLLVKPRAPQGFTEYLLNTKNYVLQSTKTFEAPDIPNNISSQMKDIYLIQHRDRLELHQRHIVEREKLCLNVEQEILRIHTKAARNMACQLLPFSACSYMKDDEVYNILSHEQEDKERNARYRYNGRLLLSWLQDVDDKWEKVKESMVLRHHNEAESLHAVQLMDWELALKKYELFDISQQPQINADHVPIVHVSDDFDLLPA